MTRMDDLINLWIAFCLAEFAAAVEWPAAALIWLASRTPDQACCSGWPVPPTFARHGPFLLTPPARRGQWSAQLRANNSRRYAGTQVTYSCPNLNCPGHNLS